MSQAERRLALSIIRRGFSYLPEKRLTAAQPLEDQYFKELRAMYGL